MQRLDDLKEKKGVWRLKAEALDGILWITRFGRGYGPVVRQTRKLIIYIYIYIYICNRIIDRASNSANSVEL